VQKSLEGMKKYEIPRKWELLEEGFTKERGMMTPKMSVKRHIVMKVQSINAACYLLLLLVGVNSTHSFKKSMSAHTSAMCRLFSDLQRYSSQ
jgi:hypothetical protein